MDLDHFNGGLIVIEDPRLNRHCMGLIIKAEIPENGLLKVTCNWTAWKDIIPDKEIRIALGDFCASEIGKDGKSGALLENKDGKNKIILLRK